MVNELNNRLKGALINFDRWDFNQKDLCINLSVRKNSKLVVVEKLFVWDLLDFCKLHIRDKNGQIK